MNHQDLQLQLNEVKTLFKSNQQSEAFSKLLGAHHACPKHDLEHRDKIADALLNFAGYFVQEGRHADALTAAQLAQSGSILFAQLAEETVRFIEGAEETNRAIALELEKQKQAEAQNDLDAVAAASDSMLRHRHLHKNRNNPVLTRQSPYLDYPSFIHMETLAVCNAACTFCPYPDLERKGTRMPDQLIEKIIDDLTEIPQHVRFQIAPYKVSDPFIEKRLIDIITLINEKLPNAFVSLISNGSTMTEKVLSQLSNLKHIEYLVISLNDHRKEEYESLMALPFERTLDRLDMLAKMKRNGSFNVPVVLNRVAEGNRHDLDFSAFCRDRYPEFEASVTCRNDWIGSVNENTTMPQVPDVACKRWSNFSITATGKVALCCMDGHSQWSIGDVNDNSVLEIYNTEEFRNLRENVFSRSDASTPCNKCTYI